MLLPPFGLGGLTEQKKFLILFDDTNIEIEFEFRPSIHFLDDVSQFNNAFNEGRNPKSIPSSDFYGSRKYINQKRK